MLLAFFCAAISHLASDFDSPNARWKEKFAGEDNEKLSVGWQSSLLNKLILNLRSRWTLCQHARINYQIATRSRCFFLLSWQETCECFSLRSDGKIIIFVCLHNQHSASRALDREIKAAENRCLCVTEDLCESDAVCFPFAFDCLTSREICFWFVSNLCQKFTFLKTLRNFLCFDNKFHSSWLSH